MNEHLPGTVRESVVFRGRCACCETYVVFEASSHANEVYARCRFAGRGWSERAGLLHCPACTNGRPECPHVRPS